MRNKQEETKHFSIPKFPVKLRQRFVGAVKMEGRSVTEVMVELITKELKKKGL